MRIDLLLGLAVGTLLAGCSSSHQLSAGGERVTFTDQQPGSDCQLLGNVTGSRATG
nr:Stress protein H5 [Candidatus Pantoea persica]